jgi:hypothetical protein
MRNIMLYHTAIPASPDSELSPKADELSPKADRVLANSSNSQNYPAQLKINTTPQTCIAGTNSISYLIFGISSEGIMI